MTAQGPDILIVDDESISLPSMELYGVRTGDIDVQKHLSKYVFSSSADETKMIGCTALWRGYVSTYRLKRDATLALESDSQPGSRLHSRISC